MKHFYLSTLFTLFLFTCFAQSSIQKIVLPENAVNDSLVVQFAEKIESAVKSNDIDKFNSYFAIHPFLSNIKLVDNGSSKSKEFNRNFKKGLRLGVNKLGEQILGKIGDDYYDLVSYRYDQNENRYYVLFRLFGVEDGINYHDYSVTINKVTNELAFDDIYIYLSGEKLSQTIEKIAISSNPYALEGTSSDYNYWVKVIKLKKEGKFQEAYDLLEKASAADRKEKYYYVIKIMLAGQLDESYYLNTLKEIKENLPDDPTLTLILIDYYILTQDFQSALDGIDLLQEETQDDFLEYMKANILLDMGENERALSKYKYVVENYPDFPDGQFTYMGALAFTNNFSKIVERLEFLETDYDKPSLIEFIEEDDLEGENIFKSFMNSQIYKNWKLN